MVYLGTIRQRMAFERLWQASPYKDKYEALLEFSQEEVDELAKTIAWEEIE